MYYLRNKYKNKNFSTNRYTTTKYFFNVYIDKAYVNYYNVDVRKELATQEWDCGVFVVVYVEYLSKGLGILSPDIDAQYHCLRYASFLCKYESEKAENDYFSENDDPPRTSSKFAPKQTDSVLHIQ
ncbi:hypothetical protein P3S67_003163 [Capsicum chacoense]